MSVQNQTVKNVYAGNGSTTVFPFTFALLEADGEHVGVYVTNDLGTSEATDNFVIDTAAKTVTYPKTGDPLEAGRKITIRREIPNEQELNLENLGPFFAEDVEGEMDREVMMIQQLAEVTNRAITVDMADDKQPEDLLKEIRDNLQGAITAKQEAAESAAESAASAQEAAASEAAAKASETAAANSATEASVSAIDAAATLQEGQSILAGTAEYARQAAQDAAGIHEAAIPAWDAATVYSYPDVVAYTDGNNYRCIGENVPAGTRPTTSNAWVRLTYVNGDDYFEIDLRGGLEPRVNPTYSSSWDLDGNGDIMPKGLDDEITVAAETKAEQAATEAAKDAELHINEIVTNATLIELDADDNITIKESESD